MRDEKKHDYYIKNRKARRDYQRNYYAVNKRKILKQRALDMLADPELADKKRAYNRAYYLKNRARLKARRLAKAEAAKAGALGQPPSNKSSNPTPHPKTFF